MIDFVAAGDAVGLAEFWDALWGDESFPFMRTGLLLALMASIPFGIMGSFVVIRRISYIAGAIAHSILGGVGLALWYARENDWTPLHHGVRDRTAWEELAHSLTHPFFLGALAAAILSALIIGIVSITAREREDTIIGAIWVIGMSVGLIYLDKLSDGTDLGSFIFGSLVVQTDGDLMLVGLLTALVLLATGLFYNKFQAICFDSDFAQLRGVHVRIHYLLLLCLIAITIVTLVSLVGIVLVVGLITLPAATAGLVARRLWHMMIIAVAICMLVVVAGFYAGYTRNLAISPAVIFAAGAVYLTAVVLRWLARRCSA